MRAIDRGPPPNGGRAGARAAADSSEDRHGLDANKIPNRRLRRKFDYKSHPVAAELIRASLLACGGRVR